LEDRFGSSLPQLASTSAGSNTVALLFLAHQLRVPMAQTVNEARDFRHADLSKATPTRL